MEVLRQDDILRAFKAGAALAPVAYHAIDDDQTAVEDELAIFQAALANMSARNSGLAFGGNGHAVIMAQMPGD